MQVLTLTDDCIGTMGRGSKAQEQKDSLFAHAFSCFAIVQSGALLSNPDMAAGVLVKLVELSKTRSFMTECCSQVCFNFCKRWMEAVEDMCSQTRGCIHASCIPCSYLRCRRCVKRVP